LPAHNRAGSRAKGEPTLTTLTTPGILEVAAHSLAAVLGVWLGLTVVTRAGTPASRVFALLSLAIAAWSSSIIVERLSTSAEATLVAHAVEELMAAVTIAGTSHFSLAIASEGLPSGRRRRIVLGIYIANFVFAAPTIVSTLATLPRFTEDPLPGAIFGWVWIAVRLISLGIGARWLLQALRIAPAGSLRQRQVRAALATVVAGGIGGGMRFLPVVGQLDAWIGVSFVALAVVLAAYAVFSAGIFFGPAVAGRAFRTSLLGAFASFVIIALVLGVEAASRALTGVELPLFTAMALVVTVTLYEPVTQQLRQRLGGDGPRAVARRRLLEALGQFGPTAQSVEAGVQPALARLAGVLDVRGLTVARADGAIVASEGAGAATAWIDAIPLIADGEMVGELRVGATTSGEPLSSRDQDLVRMSAAYVAAALRAGRREDEQVEQLAGLVEERAKVESKATTLHAALVQHADAPVGLRVHALGPLHDERAGERIERWGGDKAGTRQAQGLFAFLFDRGERGVSKDEALELIWPDTDLERADLAFHRTMVGLRQTLDPRRDGRTSQVIRFHNDRYRLDPAIVIWSDVAAFLGRLDAAKSAGDPAQRLAMLEEARTLYGGDFVDDCPFYGDSAEVEEQRLHLRGRATDLRVAIGEAYEALGDRLAAATAFREALRGEPAGSGPAQAGLARLGL
jgi:DNA-binding SARP family transcriptional activator